MKEKRPPNYKSLDGETEEIGCPYGVFMGPERSSPGLIEIVHVQIEKKNQIIPQARKQRTSPFKPKHLTGFYSSLHAILFQKTNEKSKIR